MNKKLYKSYTNRKISGVCGGIAEYFDIDATIVRLAVAALSVFTGQIVLGFILYLLCAFILPSDKEK